MSLGGQPGGRPNPVAIVIPTIGVNARLGRLFRSLELQREYVSSIVVALQGEPSLVLRQVRETDLPVTVVQCPRGVSRARNYGMAATPGPWDAIMFLDDDVWLDRQALLVGTALLADEDLDAVAGLLLTSSGRSRLRFPDAPTAIDRRNVWNASIETVMMYRARFFDGVGGFDEGLGLGADTIWQSGESTDLILRALHAGKRVRFDPGVRVFEDGPRPEQRPARLRRARAYARGTGKVYALHYSRRERIAFLVRTLGRLAVGVTSASADRTLEDLWIARGRLEGLSARFASAGRRESGSAFDGS